MILTCLQSFEQCCESRCIVKICFDESLNLNRSKEKRNDVVKTINNETFQLLNRLRL